MTCKHNSANFDADPDTGEVWCFRCKPPRCLSTPTLTWAAFKLARQLAANRTCSICGAVATVGYHTTCDYCGQPVCGVCAVQFADGVFCPTCPHEMAF
jgi:hypothetical protein